MNESSWAKNLNETRQDIMEALSLYVLSQSSFTKDERVEYFPQVFHRLCGYLSQHAMDLHNLQIYLEQDKRFRYTAT